MGLGMKGSSIIKNLKNSLDFPLNQTAGFLLWKDLNSVFIAGNINTAKLFGLKHHRDLTGRTDHDIPCMHEGAAQYIAQDKIVMQTKKPLLTLDIRTYHNGDTKILLLNKNPFKNNNDKIIGVNCHCIEINNQFLNDLSNLISSAEIKQITKPKKAKTYHFPGHHPAYDLPKQQAECLFHLLRGKTTKMIAKIMGLSPRTIECYIDILKTKMQCSSKSELIEKAISNGFLNYIPEI